MESELARPEDSGIVPARLDALLARVKRDVDDGTLDSAQVAVARHGQLVAFETFGACVQGGELRPATNETLYTIFSSTKAVVGAATWTLLEDGLLRTDERVADIVPEFGTNGKDVVTVEQTMLHIGGFPRAPLGPPAWETREGRLAAFAKWRLNWEPGSQFEYHATSAHWVLAEIIERRTGRDFREYVRDRILRPSGVTDLWVGLPEELDARVAEVRYMEEPVPPPGGWGEVTPNAILNFNGPSARRVGVPGGGGIGTARGLAMFYQPLVNAGVGPGGTRVMKAETIELATQVRTKEFHKDPILGHPVNRGLTVVVAGGDGFSHVRGFGRTVSPRAFGHGGAGGQIGWGDPETGISLGYCTNSFVDELAQGRRITAISSLAGSLLEPAP
ncbi:MAG: beta-lactamase family protein [Dehalococcoidia bacterium]|nr:beta-lactamase family protein [Dehalococcoidia bacterium]